MRLRALLRHPGWWAVGVFVLCALVYLPTTDTRQIHNDAYSATLEAWRIAAAHTPWFDGFDFKAMDPRVINPVAVQQWIDPNQAHHLVSFRSPGAVIASIPAYWLRGGGTAPHDYSTSPGNITAALLTAAAMALLFAALRRRAGLRISLAAILVVAFATPMWSVSANWLFTHSITVVGIAGMAWAADRDRWWLVGLFGGIGLWGRLHVVVIVAILGLGVALVRRDWRIAAKVAVPSAALLALASLWSHWLYQSWVPTGGYGSQPAGYLTSGYVGPKDFGTGLFAKVMNQLGLWIAPDRGLFVWTPVILLLLPALVRSWRTLPDWSRVLLLGGLAYSLVQGQIDTFTGGDGFWGYRLMLEMLVCSTPALTFSAPAIGAWVRPVLPWVVSIMFVAIATGAVDPLVPAGPGRVAGPWLPQKDVWHQNTWVHLLLQEDPLAWTFLFGAVVLGYYLPKVWRRTERSTPTVSTDTVPA